MTTAGQRPTEKLYSPRLLALSAELANYPLDESLPLAAELHSRTCGSTIRLGLAVDDAGMISRIGMQVSACAVGQSSAAILARHVEGVSEADIIRMKDDIQHWLNGQSGAPSWPDFDALVPALPHKGRHEALLLPWKAAVSALSSNARAS